MKAGNCIYFSRSECRSCALLALPYQEQLQRKQSMINEAFLACGVEATVEPCVPSDRLFGSRNKAKMVVGGSVQAPVLGIMLEGFRLQELATCPLVDTRIPPILSALREGITRFGVVPYDVVKRKGELKYFIVRTSERSGETLVRFVLRSREQADRVAQLAGHMALSFPTIKVASINLQPVHQAVLEGEEEIILTENDFIRDPIGQYQFLCGSQSFAQVTTNVAVKLYNYAAQKVKSAQPKLMLDLYCGIGGFSTFCASYAERILGVEASEAAIRDARRSAVENGIKNTEFVAQDVEPFLDRLKDRPDLILLNPPRRGLSPRIIERILVSNVQHVLYSSCNPSTLSRDVSELFSAYQLESVAPFDMFPLTDHVEALAVLRRRAE
ncbi:MAG: 23S rRNA (uracil(1939)-C(5))-methyltransferase RlmD [Oligoflexia bacterium]|nr:23S rRNA (uracil(1939)-C(5))-methyltransferase RlmD [Oligoflexia bacterium]